MRQLIVGKNLAFAAGIDDPTLDGIQSLEVGAITASVSDTGELLEEGVLEFSAPFTKDTLLTFYGNTNTGTVHTSAPVCPFNLKWAKTEYAAPVAKVCHVGRTPDGGVAKWIIGNVADNVGNYASIRIYDLSVAEGVRNNQYLASYRIKEGDVELDVFNGLFKELEKFKGKLYANVQQTIATTNYGFAFTGIVGKNFRVYVEDVISSSVITVQTKIGFGDGLAAKLAYLEKDFATHKGFNNNDWLQNELYLQGSDIVKDANYDIFVLTWYKPNFQILAGGTNPMVQHLLIAVPTGEQISSDIEALLIHVSALGVVPEEEVAR
jgi:hypothetical protein